MSTTKAAIFKPAINIPFRLRAKFVDVRPGKMWTDPETRKAKQLPAQVSIKGTFDGVDTICYLPGAVWKNIKALAEAGLIESQDTDALEAVETATSIPLSTDEEFIATLSKPAGAKYADMEFVPATTRPAQQPPSKRLPPPESRTTKTAHRAGPDIPGMDEAMVQDEDDFEAWSASLDAIARGEDGPSPIERELAAENASIPQTPREVREREAQAKGEPTPADRFLDWYIDTYAKMLAGLSAVHTAAVSANVGPRSREAEAIPPLTSDTVQAAVATYTIQCERKGWLR